MGDTTNIEWCDTTTNPIMGCRACELWVPEKNIRRCYAGKLHENGKGRKPGHAALFLIPEAFPGRVLDAACLPDLTGHHRDDSPWLKGAPRSIFISDMGDALSESVPFAYLEQEILRSVASKAGQQHRWLWLTKLPDRMAEFYTWARTLGWTWPPNLWVGTSITTRKSLPRIRHLARIGDDAHPVMHFLSVEPQSEEVDISPWLPSIHWVIQGGESGDAPLAFDIDWARQMRRACRNAGVPYFLKQLGGSVLENGAPMSLRDDKGGNWHEWPEDIAIREVPGVHIQWSRRIR